MHYIFRMLLKHGFNVNRESTSGTALHEAVLHGRLEVTQLLCDHGADVTIKNVHGQTPLHVAQKLSAAHSADKLAAIILSEYIHGIYHVHTDTNLNLWPVGFVEL